MTPLRDRLLSKAVINWETGCWEWTASTDRRGYGRIKVGGRSGRRRGAHRVSYEMTFGPIPDGLSIDHLCRVRHCINPAHMEPVTAVENTRRGYVSRSPRHETHCLHGHRWTPENTYVDPKGYRACRACRRVQGAARRR